MERLHISKENSLVFITYSTGKRLVPSLDTTTNDSSKERLMRSTLLMFMRNNDTFHSKFTKIIPNNIDGVLVIKLFSVESPILFAMIEAQTLKRDYLLHARRLHALKGLDNWKWVRVELLRRKPREYSSDHPTRDFSFHRLYLSYPYKNDLLHTITQISTPGSFTPNYEHDDLLVCAPSSCFHLKSRDFPEISSSCTIMCGS
ncbi:5027_t:CDS:2 [Ambispora gerdemannii]|uniref:5027_t:CDS:1 n=1 Tax=Ambispora gerdemannii TaxID=144530 RepID=A0A9N8ZEH4_9GLOM|nr:5027_t:CDS:2 [Ambispora gerdemannii]